MSGFQFLAQPIEPLPPLFEIASVLRHHIRLPPNLSRLTLTFGFPRRPLRSQALAFTLRLIGNRCLHSREYRLLPIQRLFTFRDQLRPPGKLPCLHSLHCDHVLQPLLSLL
jgi:hypothetical protein